MTKTTQTNLSPLKPLTAAELTSVVGGGPRKPTDSLDPLGTSELSGSGDIIIYRDRNGEIEGTSRTHG